MARSRWIATGIEVAMIVFVAVLLLHRLVPMRAAPPSPANTVTFTLTGLNGKPISPGVYQGKAVLLNFWAPWCPPCRMEIPWLQKLQNENRARLVVVGVVADPDQYAHAAAFMGHSTAVQNSWNGIGRILI